MEILNYAVGFTRLEVTHLESSSGEPLLQVNLPRAEDKITPEKARDLATLLTAAANAADPPTKVNIGLFATIRDVSKYRAQQETDKRGLPIPFPVTMVTDFHDGYWVKGGPGGRYTLYDVDLWTKGDEKYLSLPVHRTPYPITLEDMYKRLSESD